MHIIVKENIAQIWLIAGVLLMLIESFTPGLGLLFAGIAAILTGGILLLQLVQADNYLIQIIIFLFLTTIITAILWKPLKKLQNKANNYHNIVGTMAIVCGEKLEKNKIGQVKWSGTIMNAMLDPNDSQDFITLDSSVIIAKIEGNILIVKSLSTNN